MEWEQLSGSNTQRHVWKPQQEGDEIIGTLKDVFEFTDDDGKTRKGYLLEDNMTGEEVVVWGSKVLDGYFNMTDTGDIVRIIYKGKKKGKKWSYHNYEFFRAK